MSKQATGKVGENLACVYLVKKGYKVLKRNYREKWGEIDIIARAKDRTLVFVEVKALAGGGGVGLSPEDNLTSAKLRKLKRACATFAGKNGDLIDDRRGWRIDLVAVDLNVSRDLSACPEPVEGAIRHYENI